MILGISLVIMGIRSLHTVSEASQCPINPNRLPMKNIEPMINRIR
jgi:hypothetical protein